MDQNTPEWREARVGKVTSSCLGKVMTKARSGGGMGQTAQTYMMELIGERLTGLPADEIHSKYIEWGHRHEPDARSLYAAYSSETVSRVGFVEHPTIRGFGGSPDSLVGEKGVNEIKCPFTQRNHLEVIRANEIVDKDYQWQCQGNMAVTGREWLDYVSFHPMFPEELRFHVIRVERDDDMIEELEETVIRFLEQMEKRIEVIYNNATKWRITG